MEYFYSWGLLFVLPFTLYAYIKATKEEKIKMIISGIGFGILSIIFADDAFLSYWEPKYLIDGVYIEDFLYGFLFAGILPAVHNILRKKKMEGKFKIDYKLIIAYILIIVLVFYIMVDTLKLNCIYALAVAPLIIGIISYLKVKGEFIDILITVGCAIFITVLVYNIIIWIYPGAIDEHFMLSHVSGMKLLRVPLEEWLFAICLGIGSTYTYEAVFNLK